MDRFRPPEPQNPQNESKKIRDHLAREFPRGESFLADKVWGILDSKEAVDKMLEGRDDITIHQPDGKLLGMIILREVVSSEDVYDKEGNCLLIRDTPYIELHIPPKEDSIDFELINESLKMVAEYVDRNNLQGDLIGFTFDRLGKLSRRYGFKVENVDVPDDIYQGIKNVYNLFNSASFGPMGDIVMCQMDQQTFLRKYLEKN